MEAAVSLGAYTVESAAGARGGVTAGVTSVGGATGQGAIGGGGGSLSVTSGTTGMRGESPF